MNNEVYILHKVSGGYKVSQAVKTGMTRWVVTVDEDTGFYVEESDIISTSFYKQSLIDRFPEYLV